MHITRRFASLAIFGLLLGSFLISVSDVYAAKFIIGDRVQVSSGPLNVRSKPSLSGRILGKQATGAQGTVIGGPKTGSGYVWWQINFDTGADGWTVENYLEKVPPPAPSPSPTPTPTPPPPAPAPSPTPTPSPSPTPAPTAANNLYVSPNGSDTNLGTQAAPFKTIQKAANVAVPDTIIHVAPGTYAETITAAANGTASGPITFLSDTKWGAKLVPASPTGNAMGWKVPGNYVVIDGFDIDGQSSLGWRIGIYASGSFVTVKNSHIHHVGTQSPCNNTGGAGLLMDAWPGGVSGGNHHSALNNVVHDNGPMPCTWFHGIYISSPDSVAKNNLSYQNASVGISFNHDWARAVIANNTTFRNGYIGISANGADFREFTAAGPAIIENNIAYDNNNFRTPNQGSYAGIALYGTLSGGNVLNNNFSTNNHDIELNMPSGAGTMSDNITSGSPGFVNYQTNGSGDYHLASGSQLIDKGLSTYAPSNDLDGNARPQGAGYDIGAYEYGAVAPPSVPVSSLSATSFDFGNVVVGMMSAEKTLTINNTGTANLSFTNAFGFTGDFNGSGNCSTTIPVPPGGNCLLRITFAPTAVGSRTGTVTIYTNATSSPQTVQLSGTGLVSPIAYWKLDEGSGIVAADAVGTNNGALVGSTTWVIGKAGSAVSMTNNSTPGYINVPDSSVLELTPNQNVTFSLWLKRASTDTVSSFMLSKGAGSTADTGYALILANNLTPLFRLSKPGESVRVALYGNDINDMNWHHIAVTLNRTGQGILYQDGVQAGTLDISGYNVDLSNTYSLTFGAYAGGGGGFLGAIDDVRVYNRVLSTSEILGIYNFDPSF